jgi:predicted RNase H-like HicB family nuclease
MIGVMNEEPRMEAEDYLHVPYVLTVWSELGPDGDWLRFAELPELPGCLASSESAVDVIERVEEMRVEYILSTLANGGKVPVPRPPLRA